jgi:hypothetical protein
MSFDSAGNIHVTLYRQTIGNGGLGCVTTGLLCIIITAMNIIIPYPIYSKYKGWDKYEIEK